MTQYRRWGKNSIPKPLKDYAVPLLALFLILIIIYNVFSWDDKAMLNEQNTQENLVLNSDSLVLSFDGDNTKVDIEYPSGDKKEAEDNSSVYKGEKILVKNWSISFLIPWKAELDLDKLGIIKYKEDGSLFLESSNLWVKAIDDINISMKFANVKLKKWAIANLNQNDVESSIYVLNWIAEVSNLAWINTVLWKGQKLSILVQNASDENIDLSSLKTDIDDYFKLSDWYIKNNWDYYLNSELSEEEWKKEKTSTWFILANQKTNYISFDNISDESYISDSKIDIIWKIKNEKITRITLNNEKEAQIKQDNTFTILWVFTENKINDLVFRVYNDAWELLTKFVITLYNNKWQTKENNNWFKVTNYPVDASKFIFTSPSTTWTYSTYEKFVTIRWSVPKWLVWKVEIDWYNLKSFNWSTWRYHASTDYNNLKEWTNQYEIKYYDKNWKLIFKNYYTIILKSKKLEQKIISDEAKKQ